MHSSRRVRRVAIVAMACFIPACGGTKAPLRVLPPEPRSDASAALGITLSVTAPFDAASPPAVVIFARFEDPARDAEALTRAALVESNFAEGRRYYLLNAEPGAYAVVGARLTSKHKGPAAASEKRPRPTDSLQTRLSFEFTQHTRHDQIWFAREIIAATLVEVPAGGFVFAGDLQVAATKALSAGDAAQAALQSRHESMAAFSVSAPTLHRETWFGALATLSNDADAAARFRVAAHAALRSAGWSARLRAGSTTGAGGGR